MGVPPDPNRPVTNTANPALVSATLNAFSPQAPSKQFSGGSVSSPAPMPSTTWQPTSGFTAQPQTATQYPVATSPTMGTSPLTQALSKQSAKSGNQWWMGGQKNYTY